MLKIVQLSDLHCRSGESFPREKLQTAVNEINEYDPDLVVVTGDLTEDGFKNECEEAKRFLDEIAAQKMMVPGNHDMKYTGHLIFQQFFSSPTSFMENGELACFCANTARPDKEEGRFGQDQMNTLTEHLSNLQGKRKVVAMHHHLIPIPDTGLERATIEDAGDVLKLLSSLNVNLVLCGHRHRPWLWRLGSTILVFSGAVCTPKLRGFFENSYNLIEIQDRRIDVKLKIVGGRLLDFKDVLSKSIVNTSIGHQASLIVSNSARVPF
jgi:Icc protein